MRANAGFLILLGLLLITGTVSALMAESPPSTIVTSKEWVVANNIDSSVITVVARNLSTGQYLPGVTVTFTVDDANLGLMSPASATTDATGVATSSFMTKTKSGTALITATIASYDDQTGGSYPHTTIISVQQKIDHDLPQSAVINYPGKPGKLLVGNISVLNITIFDAYGNLVDNKGPNPVEHHTFNLYMPGGQGRGLYNGSGYSEMTQVETDTYGNASIRFRMAEVAQQNMIYGDVIGNMVTPPEIWIEGIALQQPVYILQIHPSPDDIDADGVKQFGLYYYVYDMYMNPVNGTAVHIEASDGMIWDRVTNILGSVFITFGPKDTASTYNVTMNADANSTALCTSTGYIGACSQNLTFHNTAPVDLVVTANPQGMPSYDVNPASRGTVIANVVDIKGNSVVGETVTFTMGTPTYPGGPYNETSAPSLTPATALTATGGVATATFTPGAFATYVTPDAFNATATGEVVVEVKWTNAAGTITKTKYVTFIWKNYPYLSLTVPTDACKNKVVGDNIDIKLSLFGDGAALQPKPIDVVLVTDVSGSMAGTKISDAKKAGKVFAASMSGRDRVGLESYGWNIAWPWESKARDDLPLTYMNSATLITVNSTIDTYYADDYTPQRAAIYNATRMIKNNPRSGAVKAMVLLTDGQWNYNGDPRGIDTSYTRYTWAAPDDPIAATDSVVTYAANNGIRMYTVGLGAGANAAELQAYATETGGKYYFAPSSSELTSIYQQIAGDLQETAGGSTQVTLDYGTVNINGALGNLLDYMDYVPVLSLPSQSGDSTYVMKKNITKTGTENLIYQYSRDDTVNWTNKEMKFDVGEMKLNETWATSFRVNLTKAGQVELFGPTSPSQVCFTDASTGTTTCQKFPPFSCPIQQSKTNIGFGGKNLSTGDMSITADPLNPKILKIAWNVTYDGEQAAQQTAQLETGTLPNKLGLRFNTKCVNVRNFVTVDTTGWAPGTYEFRILASADDSNTPPDLTYNWVIQPPTGGKYIKLE